MRAPLTLGLAVGPERGFSQAQVAEDAWVHRPDDIQIGVGIAVQTIERAEEVGLFKTHHLHLAAVGDPEGACRGIEEWCAGVRFGARQHPPVPVDEIGSG